MFSLLVSGFLLTDHNNFTGTWQSYVFISLLSDKSNLKLFELLPFILCAILLKRGRKHTVSSQMVFGRVSPGGRCFGGGGRRDLSL